MNESPNHEPSRFAKERLRVACQTKDQSKRLTWALTIGAIILLALLGMALIDYWLMLSWPARVLGATLLATLLSYGFYRLIQFWGQPTRLKEAALDVEAQRPELGCEVSTAAEYLAGERTSTHDYEPELVAALQAKAAEDLRSTAVPYKKRLLGPIWLLGGAVLGLVLFVAIAPVGFTALTRTALPFLERHYTQVEVTPGDIEIPAGQDLNITNIFSGRLPSDPRFHWQEEGNPIWQTVTLSKSSDRLYVYPLKNLRSDLKYRVTGGDAASHQYEIKTYIPPEVKDLRIQINYPEYTRLKATVQQSPDLNVVRASAVTFQIAPSAKLARAALRFSDAPGVELKGSADNLWTADLRVVKDMAYWIELTDEKGHKGSNEKPYQIKAMPDVPPKVEITQPGQDIRAEATNTVPLKISVADDFGVAEIKVVYHKLGGPEQVIDGKRESETNGEVIAGAELALQSLDLKEYELVAYHAEAKDNNSLDGPGIGKSPVYFIEITNEEGGASKSQGKDQTANLLVIQKQIIADTTALAVNAAAEKFDELAAREKDATEFGRMYADSMSAGGPQSAARNEMEAAVQEMQKAIGFLDHRKRSNALPPEESALAHCYQVLKLMPQLENLPTKPKTEEQKPSTNEMVNVVLEAIKKKQKEQPDDKETEEALQEAKDLRQAQASVNSALQNRGQASGQGKGKGQGKGQGEPQGQGEGEPKEANKQKPDAEQAKDKQSKQSQKNGKKSKATAAQQGKGEGEKGEGKNGEGKQGEPGEKPSDQQENTDPVQMADQENQLSQQAAALAQKLQRLAGKDVRLGHNAGQNARQAAHRIDAAAQALKQGNFGAAGVNGLQGEVELNKVIAQLERRLKDELDKTDVASEEAPKEYEALISEYLRKLSYAE